MTSASACNTDTTQTQLHRISNTQRTKNITTDVVIQQHSRKLLMMDILMSETCWAHKKWNKISKWHQVGLLFFSYYNDARSDKHKEICVCLLCLILHVLVWWWPERSKHVTLLNTCDSAVLTVSLHNHQSGSTMQMSNLNKIPHDNTS